MKKIEMLEIEEKNEVLEMKKIEMLEIEGKNEDLEMKKKVTMFSLTFPRVFKNRRFLIT